MFPGGSSCCEDANSVFLRAFGLVITRKEYIVAEHFDEKNPAEIESLNENILDADEASLDELEQVSGGAEEAECGSFSCGTYTIQQNFDPS
jgi:hypothetical protein